MADLASARRSSAPSVSVVAASDSVASLENAANILLEAVKNVSREADILAGSLARAATNMIIDAMPKRSTAAINPPVGLGGPSRPILRIFPSAAADHHSTPEAAIRDSASGSAIEHGAGIADNEDNPSATDKSKDRNNPRGSHKP